MLALYKGCIQLWIFFFSTMINLRPLIHDVAATFLIGWSRRLYRDQLRILMFHGLTDQVHEGLENCQNKHLHVSRFEALMAHLAASYSVLSMDDVVERLQNGAPLPPFPVVLTFDDGFCSNYELAFPILQRYKLPAIIYLATQFVDEKKPIWVDRVDYAIHHAGKSREELVAFKERLKALPHAEILAEVSRLEENTGFRLGELAASDVPKIYRALSWEQIREMGRSGLVSFGSHTHSHMILGRAEPEVIRQELRESRELIERETGLPCQHFCYPNGAAGDFSIQSEELLNEAGFRSSITTLGGMNAVPSSPFLLRRLGMTNDLRRMQIEQYLAVGDSSFLGLLKTGADGGR